MAHMTLMQRAELIKSQKKLKKMTHTTLLSIYRRHGVKYRGPSYYYMAKLKDTNDLI